jgi:hypothetical protein
LIIANDPNIAFRRDGSVDVTANESEHSKGDAASVPDKADNASAADKQDSNPAFPRDSKRRPAPSDDINPKVPINEFRAQVEDILRTHRQVEVEDAETLLCRASDSLTLVDGQDIPDFGSDDSDGPPSDMEFA